MAEPQARAPRFWHGPWYRTCAGDKKEAIRVAFREQAGAKKAGHWGCVGRNSVRKGTECSASDASLNVNPALAENDSARFRTAALHEMGHALGFKHEHQHPAANCWDQIDHDAAFVEYSDLPEEKVEVMFKALIDDDHFDVGRYDQASIMHYSIPKYLFRKDIEPTCFVPQNKKLSDDDKEIARAYYPPVGGRPPDCVDIASKLFMSLAPTREQKLVFGKEMVRTLAAGTTAKKAVTFKLGRDSSVQFLAKRFGGQRWQASPENTSDCTPTSLKRKATCNLSADGSALVITIN